MIQRRGHGDGFDADRFQENKKRRGYPRIVAFFALLVAMSARPLSSASKAYDISQNAYNTSVLEKRAWSLQPFSLILSSVGVVSALLLWRSLRIHIFKDSDLPLPRMFVFAVYALTTCLSIIALGLYAETAAVAALGFALNSLSLSVSAWNCLLSDKDHTKRFKTFFVGCLLIPMLLASIFESLACWNNILIPNEIVCVAAYFVVSTSCALPFVSTWQTSNRADKVTFTAIQAFILVCGVVVAGKSKSWFLGASSIIYITSLDQ